MTTKRIRCMVVDDAALMRATIRQMIETDPGIEVIDTAGSGPVALEKVKALRPDVVTLDVEMPGMDGITVLKRIMAESPTSVVMLSTVTQDGAQRTLDALEAGAVDYVGKPTGQAGQTLRDVTSDLIAKIKTAAAANLDRLRTRPGTRPLVRPARVRPTPVSPVRPDRECEVLLAIGISAGGPATLVDIFTQLPAETPPILITQHMPSGFTKSFADRLDRLSNIAVKEAQAGDIVRPNQALIAPGHAHMVVRRHLRTGFKIALDQGETVCRHRPSVDRLFRSVAEAVGKRAIGLIMTGMGNDGAEALGTIRAAGGLTFAQSQETCVVYGMPKVAIQLDTAGQILDLESITALLSGQVPVPA